MAEDKRERKLLNSERAPGRNYDLYDSATALDIFVEGSAGVTLGASVSRLEFHRIVDIEQAGGLDGEALEVRERVLTMVIPTPQLVEFLTKTVTSITSAREGLMEAMQGQTEAVRKMLTPRNE